MEVTGLVWVAASIFVSAVAQSIAGFGFALLSVPLMTLVVDPRQAVVISTLVAVFSTTFQAVNDRNHTHWSTVRRLTISGYIGMPFGLAVFVVVSEGVLRLVLGVVVFLATLVLYRGFSIHSDNRKFDWSLGFLSGVLSTSTSTNGPPLVFLMQARNMNPDVFRATLNTVFAIANIGALSLFLVAGKIEARHLQGVFVAIPSLIIALRIGYAIRPRVNGDRFKRLVLFLLMLSGVSVVISAFTH